MDLNTIELLPGTTTIRVRIVDADGERDVELAGERAARVLAAAQPFFAGLAARSSASVASRVIVDLFARQVATQGADGSPGLDLPEQAVEELVGTLRDLARAVMNELVSPAAGTGATLDAAFWSDKYRTGHDRWELGRAAPPLSRWLAEHPVSGRRVLVPGCGRGNEARLFAKAGNRVVGVDLAPEAIAAARKLAVRDGVEVDFRVGDVCALGADPLRYDLVVEHTCLCALDPRRRVEYATAMTDVLVRGGELWGLFYAHGRPGGPPFAIDRDGLLALFSPRLELAHEETPRDSIATRMGEEILAVFRKR